MLIKHSLERTNMSGRKDTGVRDVAMIDHIAYECNQYIAMFDVS